MLRECDICGRECEEKYMVKRSPSPANPKWLCWDCFRLSQREANLSDHYKQQRLYRIHEGKKGPGKR